MDTSAYLSNQGWLGDGHSLHPSGRGIKKPLLVSHKKNVLGIGLKKHDVHADQWWARAFDSRLKDLKLDKNEATGDISSVAVDTWGALDVLKAGGAKWAATGDLYAGFVKGASLVGTIRSDNRGPEDIIKRMEGSIPMACEKVELRSEKVEKRKRDPSESISSHKKHKGKKKKRKKMEKSDTTKVGSSEPFAGNKGQPGIIKAGLDNVERCQAHNETKLARASEKEAQEPETGEEASTEPRPKRKRRKHIQLNKS